jgi:hypothetical protein
MVIHYKKREELLNEEKAKERSENEVCIFTILLVRLVVYRLEKVRIGSEKASTADCKGMAGEEIRQG